VILIPIISKNNNLLTVLVYFTIKPNHQMEQLDLIRGFVEKAVKKQHGFISANFHTSTDGTRIANYAQWRSVRDYNAAFANPEVISAGKNVFKHSQPEMRFYELVYSNKDTPIKENSSVATVINYFTVKPENQQKMIDAWIEFVESYVKKRLGFISANLHKSTDGTRVFNYAQWERKEDVEAMLSSSDGKNT
jgi:heme-degrading monooxygenase HmoA